MKKTSLRLKALVLSLICAVLASLAVTPALAEIIVPPLYIDSSGQQAGSSSGNNSGQQASSPSAGGPGHQTSSPSGNAPGQHGSSPLGNGSGHQASSPSAGGPGHQASSPVKNDSGQQTVPPAESGPGHQTAAPAENNSQQQATPPADHYTEDPTGPPTLWIVGDSTASAFDDTSYYLPRYGWGTQLHLYLQGLDIRNLAVSGTSSKSYLDTEQYQTLLQNIKAGDYLMIGFGHNDERAELGRYTNPNDSLSVVGSFKYYLYESYIKIARDRNATPILVTPIVRRNVASNYAGESGHITDTITNEEGTFAGGDYAKSIWQLGVGKSVPVLDLTARTRDVYEQLGADGVKNRHAWTSEREVSLDNTHTNLYGAACNAWFIADELLKSNCSLKNYVIENPQVPEYTDAALNPNYQSKSFTAPSTVSNIWNMAGEWKGTVFGNIEGYEYLNNMYFSLQSETDGSIHMISGVDSPIVRNRQTGGISPGNDGIAMYYQQIPSDQNFTLSADVTIESYNASILNSFGLMVRDDIYLDTVTNDTLGDYVAAGQLHLNSDSPWNCFARKSGQLISGGNSTTTYQPGDTVHVEIRKGSDGYTCIFGENPPVSAGFDFPLTAVDSEYVYVGMFVARSADVTFRNINLVLQ